MQYPFLYYYNYLCGRYNVDNGQNWISWAKPMQRYMEEDPISTQSGQVNVLRWRWSLVSSVSDSELHLAIFLSGDFLDWSTWPSALVQFHAPWFDLQLQTLLWQGCRKTTDHFQQKLNSITNWNMLTGRKEKRREMCRLLCRQIQKNIW